MTKRTEPYFEIRKDFKGEYVWVLRSPRGDELAVSGESFKMRAKCTKSIPIAREFMVRAVQVEEEPTPLGASQ